MEPHYSYGILPPENHNNGHEWMGEVGWHNPQPERGRFALLCSECFQWTDGFNWKHTSPNCFAFGSPEQSARFVCEHCTQVLKRRQPYALYLKSEHWHRVRGEALERADYHCQLCFAGYGLEVHHNNYRNRGKEKPSDVIVLCRKCHASHHGKAA